MNRLTNTFNCWLCARSNIEGFLGPRMSHNGAQSDQTNEGLFIPQGMNLILVVLVLHGLHFTASVKNWTGILFFFVTSVLAHVVEEVLKSSFVYHRFSAWALSRF